MKKIFYIVFNFCNIISIIHNCQNNLDPATQSIVDNAKKLQEKLTQFQSISNEIPTNLSLDMLQHILTAQLLSTNPEFAQSITTRKTAHEKLESIATWFEQEKTIDDWINYSAIHNQMINAINNELDTLKNCPELCQKIFQRILQAIHNACTYIWEEKILKQIDSGSNYIETKEMLSFIYIEEDYLTLFQKHGFSKTYKLFYQLL